MLFRSLLWACKGFEAGTGRLPHEIITEELGPEAPSGVLTGPSFAAEVGRGLPAAVTLAARDAAFAHHWVSVLHQPRLRIYANTDLVGCEVGGAVKNVMAIAAGVSDASPRATRPAQIAARCFTPIRITIV